MRRLSTRRLLLLASALLLAGGALAALSAQDASRSYFLAMGGVAAALVPALALAALTGVKEARGTESVGNAPAVASKNPRLELFAVSFLILFLETAILRWVPAYVQILSHFTNFLLMAAFLGIGLGCLAVGSKRNHLAATPWLVAGLVLVSILVFVLWNLDILSFAIDTGFRENEIILYGADYEPRGSRFGELGIAVVVIAIVIAVAAALIGPGQAMGRLFDRFANPVSAYAWNIGGSVAGVVVLVILSFLRVPATVWFLVIAAILVWLLARQRVAGLAARAVALVTALVLVLAGDLPSPRGSPSWSPYYKIRYSFPSVYVNERYHQKMESTKSGDYRALYEFPYHLRRDSGGAPFGRVLVIGAGTGNDVSYALANDVASVDAVEIDPVILEIGRREHPDRPYDQEGRVHVVNDDGRSHLRARGEKYDLVVYALVDSLTVMGNLSSVRLESYLFTREAFEDIRRRLAPGGVFVMYNYFRENWLVHRLSTMLAEVFGAAPVLVTIPPKDEIRPGEESPLFPIFVAGDTAAIERLFESRGTYRPDAWPEGETRPEYRRSRIVGFDTTEVPRDDWPFVYLKTRHIPSHNAAGLVLIAAVAVLLVGSFLGFRELPRISPHYFFLGAAFMLLETEAIVQLALLHGATWFTNSIVFVVVLGMILAANLFVLARRAVGQVVVYLLLFASLGASYAFPPSTFLGGPWWMESVAASAMVVLPILFAGVVFATSFRSSTAPALHLGSNLLGVIFGGILEYASLLWGYRVLLVVAAGLYALSFVARPRDR